MRWGPSLVALAVSLAGCSAGGDADGKSDVEKSLAEFNVVPTATTGALRGVVVDANIRPIADAEIGIPTAGLAKRTGGDGLFGFEGLEPGVYFLNVSAPGYYGVQQSAEVAAGKVVTLRVLLQADLTPQPYHGDTMKFDGFFEVGSGFVDEVLTLLIGNTTPTCNCVFGFASDGPMATLVVELTYKNNIADPPVENFWTMDVGDVPDSGNALYFCYPNPCIAHFPASNFTAGATNFTVKVWSDPAWIHVQQEFQLFVTFFYVAEAPKGWSFIDGDP